MPQKRRTLGDRNRASIALDPTPELEPSAEPRSSAQPTPAPTPVKAPQKPRTAPITGSTPRTPAPARKTAVAAASDTARLGIYLTPEEFDDAKAGYLADWSNGGEADTFGKWIAAAIEAYAARTPKQRAAAPARGRAEERTGSTRSFAIPSDTVGRMRAAITADQKADRWPSDSAWCGEAIAAAVDAARTKNDGSLPTPPPRLPNRLVR